MKYDTAQSELPVFFFDIDNCLYSRSKRVHDMMKVLINKYFREKLDLDTADARSLHETYYKNYGLALEGLVRHHKIDPLEYNAQVDDALPLEDVLHPDPELRRLIEDIDRYKVRLWLFTNAYVTHGMRVVKLLGIEDLFDGMFVLGRWLSICCRVGWIGADLLGVKELRTVIMARGTSYVSRR